MKGHCLRLSSTLGPTDQNGTTPTTFKDIKQIVKVTEIGRHAAAKLLGLAVISPQSCLQMNQFYRGVISKAM